MKSEPLPEKRRPPRAADRAIRTAKHEPAAFHPRVANGLARDGNSRQSCRSDHDPEYRTEDTSGGNINESGDPFERACANISCGGVLRGGGRKARPPPGGPGGGRAG